MKIHEPEKPNLTFDELKENNEEAYCDFCSIALEFASKICKEDPESRKLGLEGCQEIVLNLIEKGYIKLVEYPDGIGVEVFNPLTGQYR